jgi:hypothetical protein
MNEDALTTETRRDKQARDYMELLEEAGHEPLLRVKDHFLRIEEYWCRWLGWSQYWDPETQISNAAFLLLEAASEIAGVDVAKLPKYREPHFKNAWGDYLESLAAMRKCAPQEIKINGENAHQKFRAFVDAFKQ